MAAAEVGGGVVQQPYNVLFVCSRNSARSIMAEAILNSLAVNRGRFKAYSAGSDSTGQVDYFAFEQIRAAGLPAVGLRPKSWNEFTGENAPRIDFVFILCDITREACPVFAGDPIFVHWELDDPVAVEGDEPRKRRAFSQAFIYLYNRLNIFASLPLENLDRIGLKRRLDEIGAEPR